MTPRILLAEDSETFGRPLQRTLEIAGRDVSVVGTDCFIKPFEPSKLVDAVRRALVRPQDRTVAIARRHS